MCSRAAVHRLFSRSDLASGQKRWQVKISIYLNTMMTYLALRFGSVQLRTAHCDPGIPLEMVTVFPFTVGENLGMRLSWLKPKYQEVSTPLCCLWKFLRLNQVCFKTLPSSYAKINTQFQYLTLLLVGIFQ